MLKFIWNIFDFFSLYSWVFMGIFLLIFFILGLAYILQHKSQSKVSILFEYLYEKVYLFYEEILWVEEKSSIKSYVVTLFFVILFANLFSVILDFIAPIFWTSTKWWFFLSEYISLPTTNIEFTLTLSSFSVFLLLFVQIGSMWIKNFFLTYIPLSWKKYFSISKGSLTPLKYFILLPFVKIADLILSFFLAFLDILWLFAKVISLAFRLFGNMTSGTVLLGMVMLASSWLSLKLTQFFGWFELPLILPLFVIIQGILVAVIQAMVFALLVSIFIRISQMEIWAQ